jgi:hypothetical protein
MFHTGNYRNRGHNPKKMSWVRVPVRGGPYNSETKHDRIKGTNKTRVVCFEEITGTKATIPKKIVVFVSL